MNLKDTLDKLKNIVFDDSKINKYNKINHEMFHSYSEWQENV